MRMFNRWRLVGKPDGEIATRAGLRDPGHGRVQVGVGSMVDGRVAAAHAPNGKVFKQVSTEGRRPSYDATHREEATHFGRAEVSEPVHHSLEADIAFDTCAVVVVQQVLLVERPVSVHEDKSVGIFRLTIERMFQKICEGVDVLQRVCGKLDSFGVTARRLDML